MGEPSKQGMQLAWPTLANCPTQALHLRSLAVSFDFPRVVRCFAKIDPHMSEIAVESPQFVLWALCWASKTCKYANGTCGFIFGPRPFPSFPIVCEMFCPNRTFDPTERTSSTHPVFWAPCWVPCADGSNSLAQQMARPMGIIFCPMPFSSIPH